MRIGIISINIYSGKLNLACALHTYAMQRFLELNGIDSKVIDYKPSYDFSYDFKDPSVHYKKEYQKAYEKYLKNGGEEIQGKNNMNSIMQLKKQYETYNSIQKERAIRFDKYQGFINKYYKKTKEKYNSDTIEVNDPGFDIYICATDVIWKTERNKWGMERAFFLATKTMENKRKIAYAASRNQKLRNKDKELFFRYLNDFDAISVREEGLKNLIENNSSISCELVLDPVLLLDKEEYEKIAIKPKEENYLFLYYVKQEAEDTIYQAINYAYEKGLKIVEVNDRPYSNLLNCDTKGIDHIWRYDLGPEEWLGYFLYADSVFTNSFHACCFSVLFQKDLYVGTRNGEKVGNILKIFNISDRQFDISRNLITDPLIPIDYANVQIILDEMREKSKKYILSAIERCSNEPKMKKDYSDHWMSIQYPLSYEIPLDLFLNNNKRMETRECFVLNNRSSRFELPELIIGHEKIIGYKMRVKIDNMWFVLLCDGRLSLEKEAEKETVAIINPHTYVPSLPVSHINKVIVEAVWGEKDNDITSTEEPCTYSMRYNSRLKADNIVCGYSIEGKLNIVKSGAWEYKSSKAVINDGYSRFQKCAFTSKDNKKDFIGWKLRVKIKDKWYWYMNDGTLGELVKDSNNRSDQIQVFKEESFIPKIQEKLFKSVVAEAVWKSISI